MVMHIDGLRFYKEFCRGLFQFFKYSPQDMLIRYCDDFRLIDEQLKTVGEFIMHVNNIRDHLREEDNMLNHVQAFMVSSLKKDPKDNQHMHAWTTTFSVIDQRILLLESDGKKLGAAMQQFKSFDIYRKRKDVAIKSASNSTHADIFRYAYDVMRSLEFIEEQFKAIARYLLQFEQEFSKELEFLKKEATTAEAFENNMKSWLEWARKEQSS